MGCTGIGKTAFLRRELASNRESPTANREETTKQEEYRYTRGKNSSS
jgi:hypothetical protein